MGPLTRRGAVGPVVFSLFFPPTTLALIVAFYGLLTFVYLRLCACVGVGDGLHFGTIRDLVFKSFVDFSHCFSCTVLRAFFLVCFRYANKPNMFFTLLNPSRL